MADNVPITAGSGTNVASDDIAGVHYQRVKTTWGPDGTANDADVATGKPLPTQIRSATGLIPIGEPTDAKNTATDTTSVSAISIWKQISASAQALVTAFGAALTRAAGAVDANTQRVTLGSDDPAVASLAILDDWDEADRAKVNLIPGQAGITAGSGAIAANTPRVALALDSPGVTALGQAAAAASLPTVEASDSVLVTSIKTDDAAFAPGTTPVQMIGLQADEGSTDSVDEGDAGAPRMTLDRKTIVTQQPHTAGGLSVFRSLDLDESEEDVKTAAGQVYGLYVINRTTSPRYLRIYNDTAANVVVGTTAPLIGPIEIPANASDHTAMILNFGGNGIAFSTAISAAVTTGFADNDAGAPGANDVIINIFYK